MSTMKVSELIALLQKQDPDAEVYTEGCDCIGDVAKHHPGGRIRLPGRGACGARGGLMTASLRGRFCAHGVDGGSDCDACRREMLQAQCQQARSTLTAAGIGEGETLADGISELTSRIADIGLLLADAREELAESKRLGAVTALRKAADELDAGTTVGILRSLTVDRLRGYAENIESGEVTL